MKPTRKTTYDSGWLQFWENDILVAQFGVAEREDYVELESDWLSGMPWNRLTNANR